MILECVWLESEVEWNGSIPVLGMEWLHSVVWLKGRSGFRVWLVG